MKKRFLSTFLITVLLISLLCSCSVKFPDRNMKEENVSSEKAVIELNTKIESFSENDLFSIDSIRNIFVVENENNDIKNSTIKLIADLFNSSLITKNNLNVISGAFSERSKGDIVLIENTEFLEEEYRYVISNSNIYIYFNPLGNCNGLLYGAQEVLKQCLLSKNGMLKCGEKSFLPDTKERTLMLDCARKLWSVKWIKNLIAEMSWLGFNTLELHLTEEQGIRANIWRDKAGNVVRDCNGNDFSFVCGGTTVSWNKNYSEDVDATYSRDDLIEIIKCAQKYHIDIIPSVDFPGHSKNLIVRSENKSSSQFSFYYDGEEYSFNPNDKMAANGSQSNTIDISSEFTRNFSYAVLQAYASFFKEFGCNKFDIASDEVTVNDKQWAEFAGQNGGSSIFDGYIIYVNSLCDILKKMGYSVRANNDYLFSEKSNVPIDKDLQVCYWKPTDSPYGSADYLISDGRTVFNCVESYCYYVLRQSNSGFDARSPECGWWKFHHSTAQRVFEGCGGKCGYSDCNESDGWNPSKLWEFDSIKKTVVPNNQLGGAYFYIWGDWAKWDTEENIFNRQDELGLIDRMWASSSKMLDWDADEKMNWSSLKKNIINIQYSPLIINS